MLSSDGVLLTVVNGTFGGMVGATIAVFLPSSLDLYTRLSYRKAVNRENTRRVLIGGTVGVLAGFGITVLEIGRDSQFLSLNIEQKSYLMPDARSDFTGASSSLTAAIASPSRKLTFHVTEKKFIYA